MKSIHQIDSPLFNRFWAQYIGDDAPKVDGKTYKFKIFARPTEDHEFGLIMKDEKGQLLVPDVLLIPLRSLDLPEFIINVHTYNTKAQVGVRRMRESWNSIIGRVYTFEPEYVCEYRMSMVGLLDRRRSIGY